MNVGHPSNLARLVDLYGGHMDETGNLKRPADMDAMRRDIYSVSIDDDETRQTIGDVHRAHGALLEPHGAVGWAGLERYLDSHPSEDVTAISLETAHPAKFPDEVRQATGVEPDVPKSLKDIEDKPESFERMDVDYDRFKSYLMEKYAR
jgi:threonine synthase